MTAFLNQTDVKRLMAQPSPHVRAIIANKLALEIERPQLTDQELQIAHDIIRVMAKDVEMIVRRAVAQNLRRSKHLPRDVALQLAEDVEAVALPILTDSLVLTDEDLISILDHGSSLKQKAIAGRDQISEKVADVVITTTPDSVVVALMNNKTAHISDNGFNKAIDRFSHNEKVKESMALRERLPVAIAERLVVIVSDKLQDHLAANHELSPAIAHEILTQGRERALIQLSSTTSHDEIENFIKQLYDNKRLTPTLVLRALCVGNQSFFEYGMAALAHIPIVNARTLIHDAGLEPLEALGAQAGISPHFVRVMRIALDVMYQLKLDGQDQDIKRFRDRLIERVLTQTTDLETKDQDYLLDLIR